MNTARAVRAVEDVAAVETVAPGMVRVVTWSDAYTVDARGEGCECPDRQYNLDRGEFCKHHYAAVLATADGLPTPFEVSDDLGTRTPPVATDGGQVAIEPADQWTLYDAERDVINHYPTRADAEDKQAHARDDLGMDPDIYPPGDLPDGYTAEDTSGDTPSATPADATVIDHSQTEAAGHTPEYDDLPERSIAEDPIEWVPGDFTDTIDGSVAINRKGFEVLSHFYGIDVHTEIKVPPEDTGHEYCRATATAVTEDGRECQAHGSAHVDRGDDAHLLLEMADTRARKRALSIATGVGAVAVEELKNEVDR